MTPREKQLAVVTAVLLVLLGGYLTWNEVSALFTRRSATIANLRGDISDKELQIEKGRRGDRRLDVYETRSLPSDRELARSVYQDWLLDLVEQSDLEEANVNALAEYADNAVFHRLTFSISGRGRLDQITRLLHRFYEHDHLHLIRRLQLAPIKDSRKLDLSMNVEAVVLPASQNAARLTGQYNPWLAGRDAEQFVDTIVARNIFAPANHPPKLDSVGSQQVELGSTVSFTLQATDADPLDKVSYALGADAPAGAKLAGDFGKFSWRPVEIGEFEFEVIAADDGLPRREARQTVRVTVVEPKPKVVTKPPATPRKLDFDVAKHTYLIGTIERGSEREIWLQNRTSGKIHKLKTGDTVSFGSIDGTVARIGDHDAEILVGEKRILVSVGKNLAESPELELGGI
jgi:hypothetical protein